MLSRKYRATRIDIEEAMKSGITVMGRFLYAKITKKDGEKPGFAIVVSKKVEKTSVGRHLFKRKINSYIEKGLSKIKTEFKKTIVFILKKSNDPITYIELEKDVNFVLNKAGF